VASAKEALDEMNGEGIAFGSVDVGLTKTIEVVGPFMEGALLTARLKSPKKG